MKCLLTGLAVVAVLAAAAPALAADPKPGSAVTVTCKGNAAQKYSCYLPKAYTPKKRWPILYCFAPDGNGQLFVQQYKDVCERRGWIVVGSLNSKNGPWEPIKAAIDAMWADTEAKLSLHPRMRYASGFSGGARVSFGLAEMKPDYIAGVIAIGAGLSSTNKSLPDHLVAWLMCGDSDFNKKELDALQKRFKAEGRAHRYENFPGAHVMPPVELMAKAVEWVDDQAADRKAEKVKAAIGKARELAEADEPVKAWIVLVEIALAQPDQKKLLKEAEKLRKKLERDPAVKPEADARKKLALAEKWVKKNAARIAKSKSVRAQAVKKLEEVGEKYPDTWAADRAAAALKALPGV